MSELPSIDFKIYNDQALEESLARIDREKHPANFQAIVDEIHRRKSSGIWDPVDLSSVGISFQNRDGIESLIVPVAPHPPIRFFLFVWLLLWFSAEWVLVRAWFAEGTLTDKGGHPISREGVVFFVVFWSLGGMLAFVRFMWMVFGKEVVSLGSSSIEITNEIWGIIVHRRQISMKDVVGFRLATVRRMWSGDLGHFNMLQILFAEDQIELAKGFEAQFLHKIMKHISVHLQKNGFTGKIMEGQIEN